MKNAASEVFVFTTNVNFGDMTAQFVSTCV